MTEQITIHGEVLNGVIVCLGKLPRATLQWQAPGLDIYTLKIPAKMYAQACNAACNEAIARNIPARSLRRVAP